MEKTKRTNYIDKDAFLQEIIAYRRSCRLARKSKKPKPKITDKIAKGLIAIAEGAAQQSKYCNYTFKDIMIADAIENCVRYFDNFNPRHKSKTGKAGNAFGYFTTCCIYAFWRRIGLEKDELYTKYKITQQHGTLDGPTDDLAGNAEGQVAEISMYENINEFIRKYEESKEAKRIAKAKKKAPKAAKGVERFVK